jgi:hypothetical protein
MKLLLTLSAIASTLSGCASYTASKDIVSVYTDKSPSPLSVKQVDEIAKREAKARDHFLDEPRIRNKRSKLIIVTAKRINHGGWRAIAYAAESENKPDGGGGAVFLNVPTPVITIDANGNVVSYTHYTPDQITHAEQFAAGNRP